MPKSEAKQEVRIQQALDDLEAGKIKSIREASRVHDVPYSTLAARRTGRPSRYTSHVSQQICTEVEEQSLNNWIQRWTAQGFAIRHDLLRLMAEHLILSRMDENRRRTISTHILGKNWTTRFVKRYSNLKTIITKPIERSRQLACTPETFNKWFNTFHDHMQKYKPDLEDIYNVDETGFAMGSTARMYGIVDRYQIGTGYQGCGAKGQWITAVECVSATGKVLPPLIIFMGKYLQSTWISDDVPEDWMVTTSPNGWTSNAIGLKWLEKHFEPHTRPMARNKYRFLILDGHDSHITPEFIHFCEAHRIVPLCIPPHTSHELQPLDLAVFSPTKHWFRRAVDSRLRLGEIRIPKSEFLSLYCSIRPRAITLQNIESGFRKAGLVPFNPALALRRLPADPLEIPAPAPLQRPQTPKTMQDLKNMIAMLEQEGSDHREIQAKINKASTIAFTDRLILQQENQELRTHVSQIREKASRKRKRIPGSSEQTVGEARKALETLKRPRTTRRKAKQRQRSPTPSDTEIDSDSPYHASGDDIDASIIVVVAQ